MLRKKINEHPALAGSVVALLAIAAIVWSVGSSSRTPSQERPTLFYSVDDGATHFRDDALRVAPFQHEGREAVRALLFTADGGKTTFVGYLEKFSDEAAARLREAGDDVRARLDLLSTLPPESTLLKKPGAGEWIPATDPRAASIRALPPGAEAVLPDE